MRVSEKYHNNNNNNKNKNKNNKHNSDNLLTSRRTNGGKNSNFCFL